MLNYQWLSQCYNITGNIQECTSVECSYMAVLESILCRQHSPTTQTQDLLYSAEKQLHRLRESMHQVDQWAANSQVLTNYKDVVDKMDPNSHQRCLPVVVKHFFLYHQAVFFIHCPLVPLLIAHNRDSNPSSMVCELEKYCVEACLASASSVIHLCDYDAVLGRCQTRYCWSLGLLRYSAVISILRAFEVIIC